MNTPSPKELAFDFNARILYLPGYALGALAMASEGKDALAYIASLHFLLKPGTIPVPADVPACQKSGIIKPGAGDTMWLLNVRDAYAELEKALIP